MPEQKQSLADAVSGYTVDGAWTEFMEDRKGRIRPGMLADIVVLSGDIEVTAPEAIDQLTAVVTICDGLRSELIGRGIDPARITVVPNSVDLEHFGFRQPLLRQRSIDVEIFRHRVEFELLADEHLRRSHVRRGIGISVVREFLAGADIDIVEVGLDRSGMKPAGGKDRRLCRAGQMGDRLVDDRTNLLFRLSDIPVQRRRLEHARSRRALSFPRPRKQEG